MPKIIDHDQRRREIIEVAKRLMRQGGFEAATMRSIAAEAGFANGALKHYFPNKESIIAATFQSALAELDPEGYFGETAFPEAADPTERLRKNIGLPVPLTDKLIDSGRILLVLWEHAASNPELAEIYRTFFARWRELLTRQLREVRGPASATSDAEYDRLSLELMSVTIGANIVSLMHADGRFNEIYRTYLEDFLARITQRT